MTFTVIGAADLGIRRNLAAMQTGLRHNLAMSFLKAWTNK